MKRQLPLLLACVFAPALRASSGDWYDEVARFEEGRSVFVIRIEHRADGDKRGIVVVGTTAGSGPLIFREAEWLKFRAAVAAGEQAPKGGPKKIAEIPTSGGGIMRVEAGNESGEPRLTLTRLDGPGGSYPDLVFPVSPEDVPALRKALDAVAQELGGGKKPIRNQGSASACGQSALHTLRSYSPIIRLADSGGEVSAGKIAVDAGRRAWLINRLFLSPTTFRRPFTCPSKSKSARTSPSTAPCAG